MSSQQQKQILLTDQYTDNPLTLVESRANFEGECTNSVIATLYGVLSDFGHETRNNRYYSQELWEKVLKSDMFKEMIRTKTLFGEPDHPMDVENRLEIHIPYVSHIIREPKIDLASQTVKGYLDILDTPYGRIIKALVDYGCVLGVSSRGSGELITKNGKTFVDPDQYLFITWDIVARPSNVEARVHEIDTIHLDPRSSNKTVSELLEIQVDKMISDRDTRSLAVTKSLLETTRIPNKEKILEKIKNSEEKRRSKSFNREAVDEAYEKLLSYKEQNQNLESKNRELTSSLDDAQDTILELRSQKEKLQEMLLHYMGNGSDRRDTICLKEGLQDSSYSAHEFSEILSSLSSLSKTVSSVRKIVESIKEDSENNEDYYSEAVELGKELTRTKDLLSEESTEKRKAVERYSVLSEKYLTLRCQMLGLNEALIKTEFRGKIHKYEPDDIENIVLDCYKKDSNGSKPQSSFSLNESQQVKEATPVQTVEAVPQTETTNNYQGLVDFISLVRSGGVK